MNDDAERSTLAFLRSVHVRTRANSKLRAAQADLMVAYYDAELAALEFRRLQDRSQRETAGQ